MELNKDLLIKQKVSKEQQEEIYKLHNKIKELRKEASKDKNLSEHGPDYAKRMKELEFQLQDNWNFERNELKHTWWNSFNECNCPILDNRERFGYPKIITTSCPFHGQNIEVTQSTISKRKLSDV